MALLSLRRPHIAHVLIATACSSALPSTATPGFDATQVDETTDCSDGCADDQATVGAALSGGSFFLTRHVSVSQCTSNNCQQAITHVSLVATSFGAEGGVTTLASTPSGASTSTLSSGVGVSPDNDTIYFVADNATGIDFNALTTSGADAGHVAGQEGGHVIGVVGDVHALIVGVGSSGQNGSDDQGSDDGNYVFQPNNGDIDGGAIYRVDFDDGGVASIPTSFSTVLSRHLFASDDTHIYWVAPGQVYSANLDLSNPTPIGVVATPSGNSPCNGLCDITSPSGLAVFGSTVAVSTLRGQASSSCNGSTCAASFVSQGCNIDVLEPTPRTIYDDPTNACMGLAIDGTDAYFGIVEETSVNQDCCGQDGGAITQFYIRTSAIGRVSLSSTTPKSAPEAKITFDTNRFYGPRRLFADASFVYGVDPAFAFRFTKSAFQ